MNMKNINKSKFLLAMLFCTIFLDVIPSLGFINIEDISATTIHIPTIIAAIVLGPFYGMIMGFIFGLLSFLEAFSWHNAVIEQLFCNPFVSIIPRVFIGLITGYVFIGLNAILKKRNEIFTLLVTSFVGSFTNTVLVLCSLYVIYADEMVGVFSLFDKIELKKFLFKIAINNGVMEALISMVVVTIFVKFFSYYLDKKEENNV